MHPVFKDVVIVIGVIIAVIFWLSPDEDEFEDPDTVTIEYRCAIINDYKNVPPEVKEECFNRNKPPSVIDPKNNT